VIFTRTCGGDLDIHSHSEATPLLAMQLDFTTTGDDMSSQ
jgi:hypothetical protein